MKKITFLLATVVFLATTQANAQDANRECAIKANLFNGDYSSKKYDDALVNLNWLLDNCADKYVSMYQRGDVIAKKKYKEGADKATALALIKRIYNQRLQHFPKKNPAKVHSDYATFLSNNKLASEQEVFALLEKGYNISPRDMGVKNIFKYFKGITERNKDTNPQKVFDTYDDVVESVGEKLDDYAKKIAKLAKDSINGLDKKQKRNLRAYTVNSKALGQVEGGLDAIISEIATCERLIPIYKRDYETNKTNAIWLRRAVSRMFNKGCQTDPLFETLARGYAEAVPSADSYTFLAGILEKNGDSSGAAQMREKAFNLETDPLKKAKYKLKFAQAAKDRGQKGRARKLAKEALGFNPNFGKAYLFIAGLYQSSANSCGKSEFEKRMVYVAALNKANRAAAVDPSISSLARKYSSRYRANVPSKKVIFTAGITPGSSHTIKCWIGETVRVPN
ncbi:MAG: tetratricopeptide repeat protein [Polaribacter sp.]